MEGKNVPLGNIFICDSISCFEGKSEKSYSTVDTHHPAIKELCDLAESFFAENNDFQLSPDVRVKQFSYVTPTGSSSPKHEKALEQPISRFLDPMELKLLSPKFEQWGKSMIQGQVKVIKFLSPSGDGGWKKSLAYDSVYAKMATTSTDKQFFDDLIKNIANTLVIEDINGTLNEVFFD